MRKLVILAVLLVAVPAFATGSYTNSTAGMMADDTYNGTLGSMFARSVTVPAGEPGGDIVAGVQLTIDMSHTWVGDLTIKLQGPGGLVAVMSRPGFAETGDDGNGCCGSSNDWVFGATQRFGDGLGPIAENMGVGQPATLPAGSWDPHGGILGDTSFTTTFGATNAVGNWTLYMGDSAGGDVGNFRSFTLDLITTPEPASLGLLALGGLAVLRRRR
jgi:subtilisin-like proprotein convertase family protein